MSEHVTFQLIVKERRNKARHVKDLTHNMLWNLLVGTLLIVHVCYIPLTTNDDYSCYRNLATFYQLAQSVLKTGSALAERVGKGGGWVVPLWLTVHGGCCSWL